MSNVVVVMLSLVIVVIIVANIVLWNYHMNQLDWERMQEKVEITDAASRAHKDITITIENTGSLTAHLVSLWITDSTSHQRYDLDTYINQGNTVQIIRTDITLPSTPYIVKIITEKGNTAVYSGH
jgi:hypothetical protein